MRTFIAIELPIKVRASLGKIQEQLKLAAADVKWVTLENIHLTLKFLGQTDNKKTEQAKGIIECVARERNPYSLRISSIGAFPNVSSPRIIWVSVDKTDSETKSIAKELEERIVKLGIPKEDRPFSPHITIGRLRSALNKERLTQEIKKIEDKLNKEALEFTVDKIILFSSTLTPKGPIYQALKEANLQTT